MSILVLIASSALSFYYLHVLCVKVLRREFSQPYHQDIIQATQLEYPRLRETAVSNSPLEYADAYLGLQCDFMTLEYLLKNVRPGQNLLSGPEKILLFYFRFLLLSLPICHVLKLGEIEAILKLATILQFFANLVGEKLTVSSLSEAAAKPEA